MLNAVLPEPEQTTCRSKTGHIKSEWLERLDDTAFIKRCRNGKISRDELSRFVRQHQLYSREFTRYLAALISNIENEDDRLALTQNLFDEMGLGDAGTVPHTVLYREMMAALGVEPDATPLPATRRMIDTMFECSKSDNFMTGLGALCLGAEGIVPYLYSAIVDGFLAVGESLDSLLFFTLHIECDDDHSETMYRIIDRELAINPDAIHELHHGAAKLIQARAAFLDGLSD
ncbi:MAG: iron-containing redox enzyme family protein [Methylomonas sp.]|nr:iron-containing redox enzyme family protein [Methylomonas sp.]